jgi:hypothetical protein
VVSLFATIHSFTEKSIRRYWWSADELLPQQSWTLTILVWPMTESAVTVSPILLQRDHDARLRQRPRTEACGIRDFPTVPRSRFFELDSRSGVLVR